VASGAESDLPSEEESGEKIKSKLKKIKSKKKAVHNSKKSKNKMNERKKISKKERQKE
jgi:hypothetical protein